MRSPLLHSAAALLAVGCAPESRPVPPDAPEAKPLTAEDFARIRKPPPTTQQFRTAALPADSRPVASYAGATVAFIVPEDAPARIVSDAGKTVYDGQLTRGQIVLIDRDAGIRAGGTAILPGPLPADASYDLYLGPDAAGQFRTGTVGPPPPR